jgi:hypothetical protein
MAYASFKPAKRTSKGAPRNMEDSRNEPKEATRCPYSNPSIAKTPFNGTPREKL